MSTPDSHSCSKPDVERKTKGGSFFLNSDMAGGGFTCGVVYCSVLGDAFESVYTKQLSSPTTIHVQIN